MKNLQWTQEGREEECSCFHGIMRVYQYYTVVVERRRTRKERSVRLWQTQEVPKQQEIEQNREASQPSQVLACSSQKLSNCQNWKQTGKSWKFWYVPFVKCPGTWGYRKLNDLLFAPWLLTFRFDCIYSPWPTKNTAAKFHTETRDFLLELNPGKNRSGDSTCLLKKIAIA